MFFVAILLLGLGIAVGVLANHVTRLRARLGVVERNVQVLSLKLANLSQPLADPVIVREPEPVREPENKPAYVAPPPVLPQFLRPVASAPSSALLPQTEPEVVHREGSAEGSVTPGFNWEQFLGVKLFAWLGGLALFVGIAFFIKYSFDRNLIPPWMRVAAGFGLGFGLLVSGVKMRRKEYLVTAQTLIATGIVVLYSASFIARSLYQLINTPTLFFLMTAVTVGAFALAVKLDARVIAVLGILGGFLTPQLVGLPNGQPVVLLGYALALNLALVTLTRYCRWTFLIPLAAIATLLTELSSLHLHVRPENSVATIVMTTLLTALFIISAKVNPDEPGDSVSLFAGTVQSLFMLVLASSLLFIRDLSVPQWLQLVTLFLGNIALLALWWITKRGLPLTLAIAGVGLILGLWIASVHPSLVLACCAALLFAVLNALLPAWIAPSSNAKPFWSHVASIGSLALTLPLLFQNDATWIFWPAVMAINLLLLGVAFLTSSLLLAIGGVLGTAILSALWIIRLDPTGSHATPLFVLGAFVALYYFAGGKLAKRMGNSAAVFFPAAPAGVPFLLLALLLTRFQLESPSMPFAFAMILNGLLIFAGPRTSPHFGAIAMIGSAGLEFLWFMQPAAAAHPLLSGLWFLVFSLTFSFHPLLLRGEGGLNPLTVCVAALSGPIHFYLLYYTAKLLWPQFALPGLFPALLAIPSLAMLLIMRPRATSDESAKHVTSFFGASILFFVTLVFPIQFDHQWLTLGWALEGVALLWLYRRAPAQWLMYLGSALLVVAFVRLALNPSIFSYQQRGTIPLLNWYLYAYGFVAAALFLAARLSCGQPFEKQLKPLFTGLATLLLFLLMNIEIADFFATGPYLTFEFSGNFARDMTYSITWSLFALGLLLIGVLRDTVAIRYAGLALMSATLLKLFLHDLTQLDALFRIGAFIGVAIILIFASWMYQRHASRLKELHREAPDQ